MPLLCYIKPMITMMLIAYLHNIQVLVSYEDRDSPAKVELQSRFLNLMLENFSCDEVPQSNQHPEYRSPDIHILVFKLKPSSQIHQTWSLIINIIINLNISEAWLTKDVCYLYYTGVSSEYNSPRHFSEKNAECWSG